MAIIALRAGQTNRYSGFVLDGHHKLAAYLAEEIGPTAIRIVRIDPPPITPIELQQAFAEQPNTLRELRELVQTLAEGP